MSKKIVDYDLDNLIDALTENVTDEIKGFEDIVNLDGAINRELYVGEITSGSGSTIDGYIRFWNQYDKNNNIPIEKRSPIKIYIDSPGGSLSDTFTIIDSIRMSKTPIWTICTGTAYSGGFFIFIAGERRIAYPHSSFLYHEGYTSNGGDANKFRNYAEFYQKEMQQLEDITLLYTNISKETYDKIKKDDFWMTAKEALALNVCDEIAEELV